VSVPSDVARVAAVGVNVERREHLSHSDSALKHFHEEAGRRSSVKGELCEVVDSHPEYVT
jgi:hypothetical protein